MTMGLLGAGALADQPDLLSVLAESFASNTRRNCLSAPGLDESGLSAGENRTWTYGQVASAISDGVRRLRDEGVVPGDVVAVTADRSVETVVALLAILFAGAVPAPLDGRLAQVRATRMIAGLHARIAITDPESVQVVQAAGTHSLAASNFVPATASAADGAADLTASAGLVPGELTTCILHTSGSTGVPKPVELTKQALLHRVSGGQQRFRITTDDVVAQNATPGFDFAWWEMLATLSVGGCVAVAPALVEADPTDLADWIRRARPSVLHFIPSLFAELVSTIGVPECRATLESVRLLFFGGEGLTPALLGVARAVAPGARIVNQYGPTEASIDVFAWEDDGSELDTLADVPIGTAYPSVGWAVQGSDGGLVGPGEVGELLLGGPQLTWGYRGRPVETALAFVPVAERVDGLDRMYRTGDLVWAQDGLLHYVGRNDDELKIHGVRLSIGEIENVLIQHPDIELAVVVSAGGQTPALTCHYVAARNDPGRAGLRDYLRERLPGAAVPGAFHRRDSLPRLPNGKLDRGLLSELSHGGGPGAGSMEPAQAMQSSPAGVATSAQAGVAQLQAIWQDVLKLDSVGPDEDFFAAGGHSLLAMRVVARVRKLTGRRIAVRTLYSNPTPRGFHAAVALDR